MYKYCFNLENIEKKQILVYYINIEKIGGIRWKK